MKERKKVPILRKSKNRNLRQIIDRLGKYFTVVRLKYKDLKEGSCGYGIDGEVGDEPAGPHLIKKKKQKKITGEGFAGGFNKDNEEFEDNRKKQAEVLGYTLTGKEDIKVDIGKLTEEEKLRL